jgi:hypothetical protein
MKTALLLLILGAASIGPAYAEEVIKGPVACFCSVEPAPHHPPAAEQPSGGDLDYGEGFPCSVPWLRSCDVVE